MENNDFNLERFVQAQAQFSSYQTALAEIRNGRKESHWMWYIFPQLRGLGYRQMAEYYGLGGLDEAKAYLAHNLLGARLIEISSALLALPTNHANDIFGHPDNLKLHSSMTLFACADPHSPVFQGVIDKFFCGGYCTRTLALLGYK